MNIQKYLKKNIILVVLLALQVLTWSVFFSYSQGKLFTFEEKLLSTVVGDISGEGDYIKVIKYKTQDGIRVEFLKEDAQGFRRNVGVTTINHPYNGFFEYRGRSVQLALGDVNGDGIMEVMAPSFDKNLTAHLNVYYYDKHREGFSSYQPAN